VNDDHFGDANAEYHALMEGAGLLDRSSNTRIEHAGSDALDLLHRLSTNDLLELAEGRARGTIVTNGDARIIDVLIVARRPSLPLLLLGGEGRAPAVLGWLDQYTFDEDSTPRDISGETAQFTIVGPRADAVLSKAAGDSGLPVNPWSYGAVAITSHRVEVVRTAPPAVDGYEVIVPASVSTVVRAALLAAGATAAGRLAYDAYRVARGIPEYGRELDERVNPHEANLLPFVSFTKGCYIGQEVVARLDTYDKVQRRLVRVVASAQAGLEPGDALFADGRQVGEVRTVARAGPTAGRAGLAYLRRGYGEQGSPVKHGHGESLLVVSAGARPL
jgi:folate-binding protein YgfZ